MLDRPVDPAWMQTIAAEFNRPATAFVDISGDDRSTIGLRWFSPATELSLCGHATLASAHVLGGDRVFYTRGGTLACTAGADGAISMRFPVDSLHVESLSAEWSRACPVSPCVRCGEAGWTCWWRPRRPPRSVRSRPIQRHRPRSPRVR
ncbi:MAG: PhzF family phenazine biosynthesis protein [Mycobacterium sp.]